MNETMHPIEPEELMAYLDGELEADRAAATSAHLSDCTECQGMVAKLCSVSDDLTKWTVHPATPAMPAAITAAIEGRRPESRSISSVRWDWRRVFNQHRPMVAWVGAVAVIFLLAIRMRELPGRMSLSVPTPPLPGRSESAPVNGRQINRIAQFAQLQSAPPASFSAQQATPDAQHVDQPSTQYHAATAGPMIVRTAELNLITKEFDKARGNLEEILRRHRGYVGELKIGGNTGSGRTLTASLRVPADQLDSVMAEVKKLGRIESESQSGQDVTSQYVDLQARLSNARNTGERLTSLLRDRTGKLSDVLEAERELDRVRGEIEQMEAERKNITNQVSYATLNTTISEDYKAQLQVVPPSTGTRLSNAAVEGYRSGVDEIMELVLFLLSSGPSLLLWATVLFLPARFFWKKLRRGSAA